MIANETVQVASGSGGEGNNGVRNVSLIANKSAQVVAVVIATMMAVSPWLRK